MKITTKAVLFLFAVALTAGSQAQMSIKKSDSSAAAPAAQAKPTAKPATPLRPAMPGKAKTADPVAKTALPAQPAPPSTASALRAATASLKTETDVAKSNAERAKMVAASDIKIDARLPGAAVIDPVTVYFVESQSVFGSIFGKVKQNLKTNNNDDPSTLRTQDGRKVIDSVKMAGQLRVPGVSGDIIEAAIAYAQARGEVVDLVAWVESETEAMSLENKFAANQIVRSIKVKAGQKSRYVFLLPAEGNVREWKEIERMPEPVAAQGQASQAPIAAGSELCPEATNFISRGFCEAKLCNEHADLFSHPTCVKNRELQEAQKQRSF